MRHRDKGFLRHLAMTFSEFVDDGGLYLAAAISFYALVSFIPLILVIINLFAYILGRSQNLQAAIIGYLNTIYPLAGASLKKEIANITSHRGGGWISLLVFLWLSSIVFDSLEYSLNKIFKSSGQRRFISSKLLAFGLVLLSGTFFTVSFWASYIPAFLRNHPNIITQSTAFRFVTRSISMRLMPFILTFFSFTAIYKFLPSRKVSLKQASFAGLSAALLWEIAKHAFAWYVGSVSILGVYGSLSAIIFFMLWIYYSSVILLLVGEALYMRIHGKRG